MELLINIIETENIILLSLFLAGGLYALLKGGDALINGAASLSFSYKIDPFAIGLTVVAFGTSLPEFFVSFISNLTGKGDIGIGNILGSNVANIALVLGISAVLTPVIMEKMTMRVDLPITIFVSAVFYMFMFDGDITRINGFVLVLMFVTYIYYVYRRAKSTKNKLIFEEIEAHNSRMKDVFLILGGIAGLYLGSDLTIRGASGIAFALGAGELAIGLTIVSIGTSLPELAASISAFRTDNAEIGVGNIIGSNVFNVLFVLGISSTVKPFSVNPDNITYWGPAMLFVTVMLFMLGRKTNRLSKKSGILLLTIYFIYLIMTFVLKS